MRIVRFLRKYLVVVILLTAISETFVRVLTGNVRPVPQHPQPGYEVTKESVQLQWDSGSFRSNSRLQVSIDDSSFKGDLAEDKQMTRSSHLLSRLQAGKTYYWRILNQGEVSNISHFHVAKEIVRYH